jgi:transcriptional regulator with XRE-family HTH domain
MRRIKDDDTDECPVCKGTGKVKIHRIKRLRDSRQETQREFAAKVGISRVQIANIETGRGKPSPSLLMRISSCYNVSADWLLGSK